MSPTARLTQHSPIATRYSSIQYRDLIIDLIYFIINCLPCITAAAALVGLFAGPASTLHTCTWLCVTNTCVPVHMPNTDLRTTRRLKYTHSELALQGHAYCLLLTGTPSPSLTTSPTVLV